MKRRNLWTIIIAAAALLCASLFVGCSKDVTLSFETNGGTPVPSITTQAGEEVVLPQAVKEGFAFDGWYASSDFSGDKFEGTLPAPEKSTKYYAKWVTGYELKLDSDGGQLSVSSLWLKEGASVYDAVKELAPQKSGLTFGAWFQGDSELARSFRMPASTVTLTAKYKTDYIIQIYLQNVGQTSYQRNDALEVSGQGYVNTSHSPAAPEVDDFTLQPAPEGREPVTTLTLSPDAEKNVYSFYYDRNFYQVMYEGNPPADASVRGEMSYETVIFGGMAEVKASDFSATGYRFAGWATSPTGDVAYLPAQQFRVTAPTTLYAVWDKGFTDRFGGSDLVFFPRTQSDKAVLYRNGVEFEGTREGNSFTFTSSETTLRGSVLGSTFSYERQDVKGTYYFYDNYPRPAEEGGEESDRYDRTRTLEVDEYLNAVYTADGKSVTGELEFDVNHGDYLFTGDGTSFHTVFQKAENAQNNIFSVGGSEFGYFVDSNGEVILLDGYGTAFLQLTLSSGYTYTLQGSYYKEGFERLWDLYNAYKIVCWLNDTSGVLTGTAGWQQYFIIAVPGYWEQLGDEYGMYFFADTSRGTYEHEGETLVLDGHGQFSDSLVYTDASGNVMKGPYSIQSDFVSGSIASLMGTDEKGNDIVLKQFHLSSDGSFEVYGGPEVAYTEYYLLQGSSLQSVLLAMFEEPYENVENSKKVEIYANNSRGVASHAGSGYVTFEAAAKEGDLLLYTFTSTSIEYGFSQTVPSSMVFTTTVVETNGGTRYNTYSMLEREGVTLYEKVELPDGSLVWANPEVEIEGEGSVYYVGDRAFRASFLTYRDEYFGDYYGELSYVNEQGRETSVLYVLKAIGGDVNYTAEPAEGLPTAYYYFDPELSPTNGAFMNFVLTPDGRAAYDESGMANWQSKGTYRAKAGETTSFGAQVYEFLINDQVRFTFVLGRLYFLGNDLPAYFRYVEKEGVYSSEDGGSLMLDGYGTARYIGGGLTLNGSYYFMTENILRLTVLTDANDENARSEYEFELEDGNTFLALDDCYGTWSLVDGNFHPLNSFSAIYFDGKGSYTITTNNGEGYSTHGNYALSDPEFGEYIIYQASINGQRGNYYVRFMEMAEYANYNCVVRDKTSGVYVDGNFGVLNVNGFGSGTLRGEGYSGNGNFYVIDEALGFTYFVFTDENSGNSEELIHILLDYDEGTFEILEGSGHYTNYIYFADDLDHIAFRDDGAVFLGNLENGDYFYADGGVNVYIYNQDTYRYEKQELALPGGDAYTYNGKTYYRYDGATFTAEGKIVMLDAEKRESKRVDASMSFDIRYRSIVAFDTTFTIGGNEYGGFSLNSYTSGKIAPRVVYNNIVYNVEFARSGGKWTFTVTDAGVRVFTRNDVNQMYYDGPAQSGTVYHQGGKIDFTFNGFGGYELEETTYDGNFLYFYDAEKDDRGEIKFSGVKESDIRTVGYHNLGASFGGYRELREIVFDCGEKTYAIDFFEYESGSVIITYSFMLYGLYEYDVVHAGEYDLGVKYLKISNLSGAPGYGDTSAVGKPIAATVLGGENKDEPIVALSLGPRYEGKGVWFVESETRNGVSGYAGAAYLIDFQYGENERVISGTVRKGMVQTPGLAASYNFYIFVDANGDVGEIMAAWYGTTQFMTVSNMTHNGNVWTFEGREDSSEPLRRYTLTFTKNTSGNYSVTVSTELIGD